MAISRTVTASRAGFTLVELVLELVVLGAISAVATLRLGGVLENTRAQAAQADLATLRDGFTGSPSCPGYLADMQPLPGFSPAFLRIHNLLSPTNVVGISGARIDDGVLRTGYAPYASFTNWSAETSRGWHGPYVRLSAAVRNTDPAREGRFPAPNDRRAKGEPTFRERGFFPLVAAEKAVLYAYGQAGEQAAADPWGNPYVLQVPPAEAFDTSVSETFRFHYARLVSAGPDGVLQTPCYGGNTSTAEARRLLRLAGKLPDGTAGARGDDLVLFVCRPDLYDSQD